MRSFSFVAIVVAIIMLRTVSECRRPDGFAALSVVFVVVYVHCHYFADLVQQKYVAFVALDAALVDAAGSGDGHEKAQLHYGSSTSPVSCPARCA